MTILSEEELSKLPWPDGWAGFPGRFPKAKAKANGIVQIITAIVSIIVSGIMINSTEFYSDLVQLKPLISFLDGGSYILAGGMPYR